MHFGRSTKKKKMNGATEKNGISDWMSEYIKQERQIQMKVWRNERFS